MYFGKKLKQFRLYKAKIGMRNFAQKIGMDCSQYSKIEGGYEKPPRGIVWFNMISDALTLDNPSDGRRELFDLFSEPFVMQKMPENVMINHATKTNGEIVTTEELVNISEYINNIAIEHNKKADEYNSINK